MIYSYLNSVLGKCFGLITKLKWLVLFHSLSRYKARWMHLLILTQLLVGLILVHQLVFSFIYHLYTTLDSAPSDLQRPLLQWGAGNVYLSVKVIIEKSRGGRFLWNRNGDGPVWQLLRPIFSCFHGQIFFLKTL